MPLSTSLTISQEILSPNIINILDTSVGEDLNVTERRIYFTDAEGNYVVPIGTLTDYVVWNYGDAQKIVDLLSEAKALNILVQWLDTDGAILYSISNLYVFTIYLEYFLYQLTQYQVANNNGTPSKSWYDKKMQLRCEIDGANNAIFFGADIFAAQNCLNRAQILVDQEALYF